MEFSWVLEPDAEYDVLDNKHDRGYKYLLSVKKIFVELLRSFVDQGWVDKIDENDVEKIDKSFILKDFREKESDLIYKVKLNDRKVFFYLLLELQSTVDFQMPYRLLQYMMGIWSSILNDTEKGITERKDFRLPVIVPCVLYNGKDNWTVCRNFKETLEANEIFDDYILDFKYILFDIKRYNENKLIELANVIGAAFYIDQKPEYEEIVERTKGLMAVFAKLNEDEQVLLATWYKNIVIRGLPKEKAEELEKAIEGIKEDVCMVYAIEEALKKEFQKYEERGIERGIEKGIEKTAINLLKMGLTVEQVVHGTGLSHERVQALLRK